MQTYQERIDTNIQSKKCPFCSFSREEILDQNQHFKLILARAPYTPDHLLIIPHRHVIYMSELTPQELTGATKLIQKWMKILHKTYPDINLLLRDGNVGGNIGKSVDHLHYHLIPSIAIGGEPSKMRHRPYFSTQQYHKMLVDFKQQYIASQTIHDTSYGLIPYIQNIGQEPEFLLIYQKEGFRGFPKGHPEKREEPKQAAKREIEEETGLSRLEILDCPPLKISYHFFDKKGQLILKDAIFFIAKIPFTDREFVHIDNNEVIDYKRCSYQEAFELLTHQNSKYLLEQAMQVLK